jgi:hypothetical protein
MLTLQEPRNLTVAHLWPTTGCLRSWQIDCVTRVRQPMRTVQGREREAGRSRNTVNCGKAVYEGEGKAWELVVVFWRLGRLSYRSFRPAQSNSLSFGRSKQTKHCEINLILTDGLMVN